MKNSVLDFSTFTNDELMEIFNTEFTRRLAAAEPKGNDGKGPAKPEEFKISPYEIMSLMIKQGWRENPATGKSDPRIDNIWDYVGFPNYTDDQSWCAGSLNCCLLLAGYEPSESIPTARSFESYGKKIVLSQAKKGDILVWKRQGSSWKGHVAFFERYDDKTKTLYAAGGNQNNKCSIAKYPVVGSLVEGGTVYELTSVRRITDMNKKRDPDVKTLKEWKLI